MRRARIVLRKIDAAGPASSSNRAASAPLHDRYRSNDSDDASVRGGALHRIANLSDHREGESVDPLDRFNRTVAIEPSTSYSMFDASEFMTPSVLDAYLTLTHSESPSPSTTALLAGSRMCSFVLLTIETDSKMIRSFLKDSKGREI